MNHLQLILLINALFSLSTGLALILFLNSFAKWFGQQKKTVFWIVGLGLLFFSFFVFLQGINPNAKAVLFIIGLDFIWVIASVVLLFAKPFLITDLGNKLIASVALVVFLLGVGQSLELSKIDEVSVTDLEQETLDYGRPQTALKHWRIFKTSIWPRQSMRNFDPTHRSAFLSFKVAPRKSRLPSPCLLGVCCLSVQN